MLLFLIRLLVLVLCPPRLRHFLLVPALLLLRGEPPRSLSPLALAATLLLTLSEFMKKLNRILYSFIWGKCGKVSRLKIIRNVNSGQ